MKQTKFFLTQIAFILWAITGAQAQTDYDLWIAGVRVTSNNASNITGEGISGKVSYKHSTKTLTLNNATLSVDDDRIGILSSIENLIVSLQGSNTVNTENYAIDFTENAAIHGPSGAKLIAQSKYRGSIYCDGSSLIISGGCEVIARGGENGVIGKDGSVEELTVNNSTLRAQGGGGSVSGFKELKMNGVKILSPAGAAYDQTKNPKGVYAGDELVTQWVQIGPAGSTLFYDLWIADVSVTPDNASNITGEGISGKVSYNHSTKTLTLNNAVIATDVPVGILSFIDNLTVSLQNTNTVDADYLAVAFAKDATIQGAVGTKLRLHGEEMSGIYCHAASLAISGGCEVIARGGENGVIGKDGSVEKLTVNNSILRAQGGGTSISDFKELNLNGVKILSPAGAAYDQTKDPKGVYADDELVTQWVQIGPVGSTLFYDLWIAGVSVTPDNASNITGEGISGKVSYNHSTKTLSLENAVIAPGDDRIGIHSFIDNLTVLLRNTNTVDANHLAVYFTKNATIQGAVGTKLITQSKNRASIFCHGASLTISGGCEVIAENFNTGIKAEKGNETLRVNNSTLRAKGEDFGSIINFKELNLNGVNILSPAGAAYDQTKNPKGVYEGDNLVKAWVQIGPAGSMLFYDLQIAGVEVTSDNASNITGDGISGKVSYEHGTKTLTLEKAVVFSPEHNAIRSWNDNLTIALKGMNTVKSTNGWSTIVVLKDTRISGPAGSKLIAQSLYNKGILCYRASLAISGGCEVVAEGKCGISGGNGSVEELKVDNSTLRAKGEGFGSIIKFKELNLNGINILSPAGAAYDQTKNPKGVYAGDELIKAWVQIGPIGSGLDKTPFGTCILYPNPAQEGFLVDRTEGELRLYNLMGEEILHRELRRSTWIDLSDLPAGTYMVRVNNEVVKLIKR